MAQKRMFSQTITNSARFLKMPSDSQSLYFHLCMNADDDGVVEAYSVLKITGAGEDNLRVLAAKKFVKILNKDLVTFIEDWSEHNLIRPDRKKDSIYRGLLLQITAEIDYSQDADKCPAVAGGMSGSCRRNVRQLPAECPAVAGGMSAQVRLDQGRLEKVRLGKHKEAYLSSTSSLSSSNIKNAYNISSSTVSSSTISSSSSNTNTNTNTNTIVEKMIEQFQQCAYARNGLHAPFSIDNKTRFKNHIEYLQKTTVTEERLLEICHIICKSFEKGKSEYFDIGQQIMLDQITRLSEIKRAQKSKEKKDVSFKIN